MLITFVFSLWTAGPFSINKTGPTLLVFVLFALLGWRVFGAAIHN